LADVDAVIAGYRKKGGKEGGLKSVTEVNGDLGGVAQQAAVPPVLPCQPPADLFGITLITVPVDQIDPCDLSPRVQPNKGFKDIKDSIRDVGLDSPISITRLPGSERFMVAGDGNTRLKALAELAREERETLKPGEKPRFAEILCIFKPYTSDIDMLAAGLRGNGMRGGLG
jgi:hypothetical protein